MIFVFVPRIVNLIEGLIVRRRPVILILLSLCLLSTVVRAQRDDQKIGGICFRIDDDQAMSNWTDVERIFERYGYSFSFGLNLNLLPADDRYLELVGHLQSNGHEMMDHTPNHDTRFFSVSDTSGYVGKPGVDHISGNSVFLQYDRVDTSKSYTGDGLGDIRSGRLISHLPGAFKGFLNGTGHIGVRFPTLGLLCTVGTIWAADSTNVDTLELRDFWSQTFNAPELSNIPYKLIGEYDMHMSEAALGLLAQRTLLLCDGFNLRHPTTWVEPGGRWPMVNTQEQKQVFGDQYHYISGTGLPNSSLKVFNEYNPDGAAAFGMQWGDFYEDYSSLQQVKSVIADGVAKHRVLTGHNHFSSLLGGWQGYLGRLDSLLAWCRQNSDRIQVRTQSDWARVLYGTHQNEYVNVFPPLNVDLDGNGVPDGYYAQSGWPLGMLQTSDGPNEGGGCSYAISKRGAICYISGLGVGRILALCIS